MIWFLSFLLRHKIGQNLSLNDKIIQKFELTLKKLCLNLAQQIVVDGKEQKNF